MSDLRLPITGGVAGSRAVNDRLVQLAYELLDAHDDTALMAEPLMGDVRWRAHVAYMRDLQRVGREVLAHACANLDLPMPGEGH